MSRAMRHIVRDRPPTYPNRKVEGRNRMVYVEEDWVDEMMTEHRDPDE